MKKNVFISYSWDNEEHKDWVKKLANRLIENEVNVIIDQYNIKPGESIPAFMESAVTNADFIIVVLTPNYRFKAMERKGGAGYEQQIISGEILDGKERRKFIPILKSGGTKDDDDSAIPPLFKGILFIDFRSDRDYDLKFDELLQAINDNRQFKSPEKGKIAKLSSTEFIKSYNISLDENFECSMPEEVLKNCFAEISKCIQLKVPYNISFQIDGISNFVEEYQCLTENSELSIEQIERKNKLHDLLSITFYKGESDIYDQLKYIINCTIQQLYLSRKALTNLSELCLSILSSIKMFGPIVPVKGIGFDVIVSDKWSFRIYLSKEEVENLLKKLGINGFTKENHIMLTVIGGLDTWDLSTNTYKEEVLPKFVYECAHRLFSNRMNNDEVENTFKSLIWPIGLA